MVPKARLELAWAVARHPLKMVCLPVPPLRQLSFFVYHKVQQKSIYFCCTGAAGAAGATGAAGTAAGLLPWTGAVAGAWLAGAAGAVCAGAGFPLPAMIEEDDGIPET